MPGVEPGSEADQPKRTTCVFVLQVLAMPGTERQVRHSQSQCFSRYALRRSFPPVHLKCHQRLGRRTLPGSMRILPKLGSHAISEVIASCCSPVVLTSSTSVARHASSCSSRPVEAGTSPYSSGEHCSQRTISQQDETTEVSLRPQAVAVARCSIAAATSSMYHCGVLVAPLMPTDSTPSNHAASSSEASSTK